MQPRPRAETSRWLFPSVRFCMGCSPFTRSARFRCCSVPVELALHGAGIRGGAVHLDSRGGLLNAGTLAVSAAIASARSATVKPPVVKQNSTRFSLGSLV